MATLPRQPPSSAATLRESLRGDRAALEQGFLKHANVARLLTAHSRLIDKYLCNIWRQLAMPNHIALVAVGGYARRKLYPRSDIDLLILLDAEPDDALQQQLHQLIVMLWDIGLEVGHSVRTVGQCIHESADITVQTNLLEARLLCGNKKLFDELCGSVQQHLDLRAFYLAKLQEQQERHARYAESDYNLEPNLKESPGGLRDLQTVTWIARAAGLGTHWSELAQIGLLTATEARKIGHIGAEPRTYRRIHGVCRTEVAEEKGATGAIFRAAIAEALHDAANVVLYAFWKAFHGLRCEQVHGADLPQLLKTRVHFG